MTLRAEQAKLSSAQAEFQITDSVSAEFADGTASVNRALSDGHIAGYAQGALLRGVRDHPGWSRYRLHYRGVGAGAQTEGTVTFDTQKKTLALRETFDYPQAKTRSLDQRIYRGVTGEILERSVANSRADNIENFGTLTRYGATLQRFSERQK